MQNLNQQLFLLMNASANLHGWLLIFTIIIAKYVVYLIPLWLITQWFFSSRQYRGTLIFTVIATSIALLISHFIGLFWFQPRPFMIGLGHTYLLHAPNSTFPSDHMTFMWAVGFSLLTTAGLRATGTLMCLLALAVGWARVFLGIHFPFDIAGAILLSSATVLVLLPLKSVLNAKFMPVINGTNQRLFTKNDGQKNIL